MKEFADTLKVVFCVDNNVLLKRENYEDSKLSEDNSLYLNFNSAKDRAIMDLIIKPEIVHIDGRGYKVLEKEFSIDGTTLFISVEKIKSE